MKQRKKIPYGISNFKSLVDEDYYFIDKTKYIEILENFNEKYLIFLRPRRFGKSLFLSMLEYYYDINYKDEKLFDEYYIGKNPTRLKNSYHTLSFTFSGINTRTEENTLTGFNNNVAAAIEQFLNKNHLSFEFDYSQNAADMLTRFFSKITKYIKNKIYVLIDEYDHFANELLGFQEDLFKTSVSQNGFVRKFYEVLKEETRTGLVDRIYITGVSSITLDSMTSGFNIGKNITRNHKLNEMLGFTRDEVIELAKKTVGESFDVNKSIGNLAAYYNGYKFHVNGKERLFNSDMVLYYMSELQQNGNEPEDYVDRNVVSDYSKIGKLFEVGGIDSNRMDVLKTLIRGEEIEVSLKEQLNLENEFTLDDFKSLLFYMGFITVKRMDRYNRTFYRVPNYVIKELYFEYFSKLIKDQTNYTIKPHETSDAIIEVAEHGKINQLIKITEETLHRLSNRDFIKFDEKYVKVILLTYLFKSKLYFCKSEYEVEDGYIDIVLLKGSSGDPKYFACLEIKYMSKKDFTEKLLQEKLEEAKEQLKKYSSSEELKAIKNLKKFAIVFCYDECKAIEEF